MPFFRLPPQRRVFLSSPDGPLIQRGPDFFSRKRNRGKKRRRGELLVPLSTPLQKGGLFRGPPHLWVQIYSFFCGNRLSQMGVTCLARQYNTLLIGGKLRSDGTAPAQFLRRRTLARLRIGGSAKGAAPPLRFLSYRFLWQRKRCPRWVSGPSRAGGPRGERTPAWGRRRRSMCPMSLHSMRENQMKKPSP